MKLNQVVLIIVCFRIIINLVINLHLLSILLTITLNLKLIGCQCEASVLQRLFNSRLHGPWSSTFWDVHPVLSLLPGNVSARHKLVSKTPCVSSCSIVPFHKVHSV